MGEVSGWTAALGLAGFEVTAAVEFDGEWNLVVQTTATRVGCPECGVVASAHGRRTRVVRDLRVGDKPVLLVWDQRLWRCGEELCAKKTWTETSPHVASRSSMTQRARVEAARRVGQDNASVAGMATEFGVGWHTINACVLEAAQTLRRQPTTTPTQAVGVDEHVFGSRGPVAWTRFCTTIVDIGRGVVLDVVDGRTGKTVADWFADQPWDWRARITASVCDPLRAFRSGLRTALPQARLVLDAFHLVKLGMDAMDLVRRRRQTELHGRRGRKGDPLADCLRVLRSDPQAFTPGGRRETILNTALDHDRSGQLRCAWQLAHRLRRLYEPHAEDRFPNQATVSARLDTIINQAETSGIGELATLAGTLAEWRPQILARADHPGVSNGPTEGLNTVIKKIKRLGFGFRNTTNYRARILLTCGHIHWPPRHQPTRLRSVKPRIAA